MLVCSVQIISRLDSQSKLQMFRLYSGRHIGVPRMYTNMAFSYYGWRMVLQKPWVSQNFRRISRVSQSRFLVVICVSQSRFFSRLRKSRSHHFFILTGLCKFLGNIYDEFLKFGETHRPKTWRSVLFSYLL